MGVFKIIRETFDLTNEFWEIRSEELVSGSQKNVDAEVAKLNEPWINVVREEFVRRIAFVEKNISKQTTFSPTAEDILRVDRASLKAFDANPYGYDHDGYPYVTLRFRVEKVPVRKI